MPKSILPIANEVNANKYLISGNGAQILDIENNQIIYANYISKAKVLEIIDICERNSVFYNIFTNNMIITKSLNYNILFYHSENRDKPEEKKININISNDIYKYINEYKNNDFLKITLCDSNESVFKRILNKIRKVKGIDLLEVSHLSKKIIKHGTTEHEIAYFYMEITNKDVNKWTAIETLIKHLGINKEDVIAIGDNVNDEKMIVNAGLGIILENGSPNIKKLANSIVASNNKNGVSQAIYENIK